MLAFSEETKSQLIGLELIKKIGFYSFVLPSLIVFHRFYGLNKCSVQACELEAWSWTSDMVGGGQRNFRGWAC